MKFKPSSGAFSFVCAACNGIHNGDCPTEVSHDGKRYRVVSVKFAARHRLSGRVMLYSDEHGILPISSMPIMGRLFVMELKPKRP